MGRDSSMAHGRLLWPYRFIHPGGSSQRQSQKKLRHIISVICERVSERIQVTHGKRLISTRKPCFAALHTNARQLVTTGFIVSGTVQKWRPETQM